MRIRFETEPCSRCGGSGKYSFNLTDGDKCYGCSGSGKQLTQNGRIAKKKYEEAMTVPASDIKPGMHIMVSKLGTTRMDRRAVISVEDYKHIANGKEIPSIEIRTESLGLIVGLDDPIKLALTIDTFSKAKKALTGLAGAVVED